MPIELIVFIKKNIIKINKNSNLGIEKIKRLNQGIYYIGTLTYIHNSNNFQSFFFNLIFINSVKNLQFHTLYLLKTQRPGPPPGALPLDPARGLRPPGPPAVFFLKIMNFFFLKNINKTILGTLPRLPWTGVCGESSESTYQKAPLCIPEGKFVLFYTSTLYLYHTLLLLSPSFFLPPSFRNRLWVAVFSSVQFSSDDQQATSIVGVFLLNVFTLRQGHCCYLHIFPYVFCYIARA